MKHRILIAGYYTAPILAIQQLFAAGYTPGDIGLLTYNEDLRNQALLCFAEANDIEMTTLPVKSSECLAWIQERSFNTLMSLYYRHIIPAAVLEYFNGRAVNLHAGLLPEYAGCWSSAWSIINGEEHSGFTWHYMQPKVDTGNVLSRQIVYHVPGETAYSLYHRILAEGVQDLLYILRDIRQQRSGVPQNGKRRYYPRALPFGGYIQPEWDRAQVERFIRAMYFPPFKGALLRLLDGTEREILTMQQYDEVMA